MKLLSIILAIVLTLLATSTAVKPQLLVARTVSPVGILMPAQQGEAPVDPHVFCTPRGDQVEGLQTPDHPCHCEHMDTSKDCEGVPQENNKCTKYCHKQQCKCPVICHYIPPQDGGNDEDQ